MRGHRAIQADWRRPGRPASTAAPAFPDNLVVFPNRDFIAVEGYQDHVGETATVEVTRPGVGVVGSAQGVVAEGDVAFEINHPGGYCWGAGTNLNITPDIQPGDVVSIRFGDTPAGDTVVQDGFVTADAVQNGTTVTVSGHVGPGLNRDNTEQRIVEPALTDTVVGRRDVRALPGPLSPAPRGGHSSSLEFSGDTFTATYVFDDADTAQIAANAGLGERLLSWQETDVDGNRQGLTIAEFGEPGGPGMGGCPTARSRPVPRGRPTWSRPRSPAVSGSPGPRLRPSPAPRPSPATGPTPWPRRPPAASRSRSAGASPGRRPGAPPSPACPAPRATTSRWSRSPASARPSRP